jgi:hypothetical protein
MMSGARITADGGDGLYSEGNNWTGGGGSGGGIYVTCKWFVTEDGTSLSADGGDSGNGYGGGGGGGRIAVWRSYDRRTGSRTVTVDGGRGADNLSWDPTWNGATGTVFWGRLPPDGAMMIVR